MDDAHITSSIIQLDLANMALGSPPGSPNGLPDQSRSQNGTASPPSHAGLTGSNSRGGDASDAAGQQPSSLRSMSGTRKAKFKKLLEQQVFLENAATS